MAATTSKKRKPSMTDDHKAKLAAGREDARVVKAFLETLEAAAPKRRGRRRTRTSINNRLTAIEKALPTASALKRLQLVQEDADLRAELETLDRSSNDADLERLRAKFVKVAKAYSERKGIGYAAWRAVGVDPATLTKAGITRSGG